MWGCKSRLSTSLKLLLYMVPLILVFVFIVLNGSNNYWIVGTSWTPSSFLSSSSFGNQQKAKDFIGQRVADNKQEAISDDYNLNRSASPPLSVEAAIRVQPPSAAEEKEILNSTKSHIFPQSSLNDSHALPSGRIQHTYSSLDRLEASLGQARAAIGGVKTGNQTYDPDYVPTGPMYWNAAAFHRSYLEMEKHFKVYVYEEGEPPVFHNGPCKSIYSMEGNFIYQMENSQFRTRDPDNAHVYFLPMSITTMVHYIYVRDSHDWQPMKQTVKDYVGVIAGKYAYWNRSVGADHFMVACHDWGPGISGSVPELFGNSIRGLCNANTSEGFRPSKDVSIPEILLPSGTIDGLIGGPSASHRTILAFFAGGVHGPIRPILLEHWEDKDTDMQIHKYLPKGVSYYGMLKQSKYCICPSGYEVASPRMVEALYTGCVPVIVKDHYVAPFSDVLNWKSFSVEVSVKDIPNLKKILMGISTRQYIRMQRRGKQVRRHFEVSWPPKRYDVFHMILHSVWLRRLNVRIHGAADF